MPTTTTCIHCGSRHIKRKISDPSPMNLLATLTLVFFVGVMFGSQEGKTAEAFSLAFSRISYLGLFLWDIFFAAMCFAAFCYIFMRAVAFCMVPVHPFVVHRGRR